MPSNQPEKTNCHGLYTNVNKLKVPTIIIVPNKSFFELAKAVDKASYPSRRQNIDIDRRNKDKTHTRQRQSMHNGYDRRIRSGVRPI